MEPLTCPHCFNGVEVLTLDGAADGQVWCLACGTYFAATPDQRRQVRRLDREWEKIRQEHNRPAVVAGQWN